MLKSENRSKIFQQNSKGNIRKKREDRTAADRKYAAYRGPSQMVILVGSIYIMKIQVSKGLLYNLYWQIAQKKYEKFLFVQWR